ncbi:MAG: DUF4435 domain-containing protein [Methanosarcinaceae archaeon]|nr:DUF4435 domain-containing protein [Methanosarcinaceae archaeon]
MKRYITPNRIANKARMSRRDSTQAILIVEGSTDSRVYKCFIDDNTCNVVYAKCKTSAIDALLILEHSGVCGVLAIVDADFWHVDGVKPEKYSKNLLITDTHDTDTMILSSDALEKMLSEYANENKLIRLGKPIREILIQSGIKIGYVRWVSSKYNMYIDFKKLDFCQFTDKNNLMVDCSSLLYNLEKNPKNYTLDYKKIKSMICSIKSTHNPWQICQGHDLIEILTIGLKEIFGNHTSKFIDNDIVSRNLRLSFDFLCFSGTDLYASINRWESNNSGFNLLIK